MISIVMAADKNYYYPLMTTMASILENKNPETSVEFYLFVDSDCTQKNRDRIDQFLASNGVAPAHFLDVSEDYADAHVQIERITTAAYYRLRIPSSLPHVDKCLYLDVDTIVRTDLSDLLEKPIDDAYIMGVLAAGYQTSEAGKVRQAQLLGIPNIDSYVNSGVLVFNLKRMRQDNLEARFDQLVGENFPDLDQDILNAACYGAIKLLPPEYNAMTKYEFEDDFYETDDAIPKCWTKWEWDKARKDPSIVHFADQDKPWTNFAVPSAKEWWHYAKVAGVAEECFDFYFDAHAAVEEKIRKLSIEMRRISTDRDGAVKDCAQAQQNAAALTANLENAQKTCAKIETDLKAQVAAAKEQEVKLKNALQSQKMLVGELAEARKRISALERDGNSLKEKYKTLNTQSIAQTQLLKKSQKRVVALEHSNSYRLGRALSAPFRWVKRVMKRMRG